MGIPGGYRVQTKSARSGWHTVRTWPGEAAAVGDARSLFAQRREIEGVRIGSGPLRLPINPRVRVLHGTKLVLDLDATRTT
jgi:hypothetical protein